MGTLIIYKFHLKMPQEQQRGGEFRSSHGQTIHLCHYRSGEVFSSVLHSLKHVSIFIHYSLTKPYILSNTVSHLFFPLLFTATFSKCLHLSCSLYCPDHVPWQRTLCIMHRIAAVCAQVTRAWSFGQEIHILMDHQTLTKMCNYLRSPHYAVPPPWWHQLPCFTH